jgi:Caspase domain
MPWRDGAVMLAVDEQALGHVERGGVGEDLVVVGFAAEPVAGDLVLGIGNVGDAGAAALEDEIGLDPHVVGGVVVAAPQGVHEELPGQVPAQPCGESGLAAYLALREAAEAAADTLLVYFAGHGRTGGNNELYLCLPETSPGELSFTALPYNQLREAVADSPATRKVVILDCCFSGRALADLAGGEETIAGQAGIEGAYILTATAANAVALAPPGERYTAFTGALLDLLSTGIPGGHELLTFAEIYPRLRYALTSRQLPQPRQRGTDTIAGLALTRNPAHQSPVLSPAAATNTLLPEAFAASLDSPYPAVRIGAVMDLGQWLTSDDQARALTAKQKLRQIADTDIPPVAAAARVWLTSPESTMDLTKANTARADGNTDGEQAQGKLLTRHADNAEHPTPAPDFVAAGRHGDDPFWLPTRGAKHRAAGNRPRPSMRQTQTVVVDRLIAAASIDERIVLLSGGDLSQGHPRPSAEAAVRIR